MRRLVLSVVFLAMVLSTATASASPSRVDTRTVVFDGLAVDVPADWPVISLAGRPGCVRFDMHAVYLGTPSADACPSQVVGHVETVQLSSGEPSPGGGPGVPSPTGLLVRGGTTVSPDLEVTWPGHTAYAIVTSGADPATAGAVTRTVRPADTSLVPSPVPRPDTTPSPRGSVAASSSSLDHGFEACAAPSATAMTAWLASPYRTVGIYIGGASRGCAQPNLTPSWVSTVHAQGWQFIPTYVGLQAPCTGFSKRINPGSAGTEGVQSADDAATQMVALGFTANQRNPVYFDMESYNSGDPVCVQAVKTFIDAWTVEIRARGFLSGVYGSGASMIANLVQQWGSATFHEPDDIWFANWNGKATVADDPYIPSCMWSGRHRIHQYVGGHNETYGGVTINIDNDEVHGATAPGSVDVAPDCDGDGVVDIADACISDAGEVGEKGCPSETGVPIDVNADGRRDLVHRWSGGINTWLSNGDGSWSVRGFQAQPGYGYTQGSWLTADVNGDGRTDLVHVGVAGVDTWVSNGDGTWNIRKFQAWPGYAYGNGVWRIADVNGDHKTDVVHRWDGGIITWLSNGDGTWSVTVFQAQPGYGYAQGSWLTADVNGDGRSDLVHRWDAGVNTWVANGDGTWSVKAFKVWPGYGYAQGSWLTADVNGDGRSDLVHRWDAGINTWVGNGDGTWSLKPFQVWPGYAYADGVWRVADVDGDNKTDLIHRWSGGVNTWHSNGDGSWTISGFQAQTGYGYDDGIFLSSACCL